MDPPSPHSSDVDLGIYEFPETTPGARRLYWSLGFGDKFANRPRTLMQKYTLSWRIDYVKRNDLSPESLTHWNRHKVRLHFTLMALAFLYEDRNLAKIWPDNVPDGIEPDGLTHRDDKVEITSLVAQLFYQQNLNYFRNKRHEALSQAYQSDSHVRSYIVRSTGWESWLESHQKQDQTPETSGCSSESDERSVAHSEYSSSASTRSIGNQAMQYPSPKTFYGTGLMDLSHATAPRPYAAPVAYMGPQPSISDSAPSRTFTATNKLPGVNDLLQSMGPSNVSDQASDPFNPPEVQGSARLRSARESPYSFANPGDFREKITSEEEDGDEHMTNDASSDSASATDENQTRVVVLKLPQGSGAYNRGHVLTRASRSTSNNHDDHLSPQSTGNDTMDDEQPATQPSFAPANTISPRFKRPFAPEDDDFPNKQRARSMPLEMKVASDCFACARLFETRLDAPSLRTQENATNTSPVTESQPQQTSEAATHAREDMSHRAQGNPRSPAAATQERSSSRKEANGGGQSDTPTPRATPELRFWLEYVDSEGLRPCKEGDGERLSSDSVGEFFASLRQSMEQDVAVVNCRLHCSSAPLSMDVYDQGSYREMRIRFLKEMKEEMKEVEKLGQKIVGGFTIWIKTPEALAVRRRWDSMAQGCLF